MSEEEKKAIDYLQFCYDLSTIDNESLPKLSIILNLIEKQQKEIEEKNIAINKQSITISKQLQEIQELKNKYNKIIKFIDKQIRCYVKKISEIVTLKEIQNRALKEKERRFLKYLIGKKEECNKIKNKIEELLESEEK